MNLVLYMPLDAFLGGPQIYGFSFSLFLFFNPGGSSSATWVVTPLAMIFHMSSMSGPYSTRQFIYIPPLFLLGRYAFLTG